jgi:hypothetical protein
MVPAPQAPLAHPAAVIAGQRMLPPLAVLLDRPLRYEGDVLAGFANELDPDGGWAFRRADAGQGALIGRGVVIGILDIPRPLPDGIVAEGWTRSCWFQGDHAVVDRHSAHIRITTSFDTAATEWVTVRQVAKVMTLAAAWIARLPGAVALHNSGPGVTFAPSQAADFLAILNRDQLPVMLWSWTRPHELTDGNVCLSTSGLVPFLGHELEVWNAPQPCDDVRDTLGDLVVYLLDAGPVIGHGDTAGRVTGDRSIRCFLGPSRAERPVPVQALFLEFEGPATAAAPRPDVPQAPPAPISADSEGVLRDFVAKMAGRDTTGMSDVIRGMLATNEATKAAARAIDNAPLDPRLAETDRLLARLKQDADATSAQAIDAMQAALRNPPPPDVIASDANPFHVNLMKMIAHEQSTSALPTPPRPVVPPGAAPIVRRAGGFGRKGL